MLRNFIRDSAIYLMPTLVSRGLALILVPLYTRVLSPQDYGALDLFILFSVLAGLVVPFEVSQGLARLFAQQPTAQERVKLASSALWFTVAAYLVFLVLAFTFDRSLLNVLTGGTRYLDEFRLAIAFAALNGVFYLVHQQFRWELRSWEYAIGAGLNAVVTAGAAILLTYGADLGLRGILQAMSLGALLGLGYALWRLRSTFTLTIDPNALKRMLSFSLPLMPSGVCVFTSLFIDRLLINHYLSLSEVGIYGVAMRFAGLTAMVMVGFQGALTPLIYANHARPETPADLARIFRVFVMLALLVVLLLATFSQELLRIFTTPAYYAAAELVIYLAPALLLANMYVFAPGMSIANRTATIMLISVAGAMLHVAMNVLLIPVLGAVGAALAALLGYAAIFVAYMILSQRLYHVPHEWAPLARATLLIGVLAYAGTRMTFDGWSTPLYKLAVVMVGILLLVCSGVVAPDERLRAIAWVRSKLGMSHAGWGN